MSSNVLEFCGLTEEAIGMEIEEEDSKMEANFVVSEEARQIFTHEEILLRKELTQRWFANFPKQKACIPRNRSDEQGGKHRRCVASSGA